MAYSGIETNEIPHFVYIWTIESVCFPCYIESTIFTVKEMEMTKWQLTMHCDMTNDFNFKIWREEEDGGPDSIDIKFELSMLGVDGLPLMGKEDVKKFIKSGCLEFEDFIDINQVFSSRRPEFLPNDMLTVRCRMWRIGTEISHTDSCFARTRVTPNRCFFVWAIRKFSTIQRDQRREIVLKKGETTLFSLNLFVTETDGEEYIHICAQYFGCDENYNLKICLLDFEGKVVHSRKEVGRGRDIVTFEQFFEKSKLMNAKVPLLPNDVLSLRCEGEIEAGNDWNLIENYRYFNTMSSNVIATNTGEILRNEQAETLSFTKAIKVLLDEGTLSDVSLRVGSKSLSAHKCILSARSPVFKAMFTRDLKEKSSKSVEIPDVDEDTLKELLSYIYTDTIGELDWQRTAELYKAADKYELLDLKKMCAADLELSLSTSSVCEILKIADMHHDKVLRGAAQDFVMSLGADFFISDTWQSWKEENSKLAWEIAEQNLHNLKR